MRLTILHVPDCPNVATLQNRLAEAIAGHADADVDINRQLVDSEQAARELGMTGSPTLLVDGHDPFAEPGRAASLSCRLYRDETGRIVGAPTVTQLRRALLKLAALESAIVAGEDEDTGVGRDCCGTAAEAGGSANSLEQRRARTAPTDPTGRAVHQAILRAFAATGHAPAAAELERVAAIHGATAHDVLANLHDADAIRLDTDGQIAVAYPFSTVPTRHRVRLASGVEVWAMCAIDALGMPAMLDTDAIITSSDPANGRPVTVTVADGHYRWDPATAVVFLSAAAGAGPSAETCCNDLNFFTTPASAQTWIEAHRPLRGEILDPAIAEQRGRRIFGSLLHPRSDASGDPVIRRG
jgi:hypothetical protein